MKANHVTNKATLCRPLRLATRVIAMLSLSLFSLQGFAQNTASGSITVNGNKTELTHAYTLVTTSVTDKAVQTILMITDKPLSAKAIGDSFVRASETRSNNVQVLQLTLDGDKKIRSVDFSVGSLKGGANTSDYKAEVARFTSTAFAGRVTSGGEQKEFKNTFGFDVRFDTTMLAPRAPDAVGKVAWATPQGKAIAEFFRAARAGDASALRRIMLAEQVKALDGPDAAQFLEFMKLSPNPKTAAFDSLVINGDNAVAKITERSKDGAASGDYKLSLINGVWRVAQ